MRVERHDLDLLDVIGSSDDLFEPELDLCKVGGEGEKRHI